MSTKVTANGCYWLSWLGEIRFTSSMSGGAESDRTWTAFEKTIPCAHKAEFSIIPCYWIWGLSIFFLFFEGNPSLCSFTDEMKCDLLGVDDRNDQVIGMRQRLLKTLIWDKKKYVHSIRDASIYGLNTEPITASLTDMSLSANEMTFTNGSGWSLSVGSHQCHAG